MKFLLQVRFNGADKVVGALPAEEQKQVTGEFEAIRRSPGVLDGNQLQAAGTAATVRVDDGGQVRVTRGPAVGTGSDRVRGPDPGRPVRRDRRGTPDAGALAHGRDPGTIPALSGRPAMLPAAAAG